MINKCVREQFVGGMCMDLVEFNRPKIGTVRVQFLVVPVISSVKFCITDLQKEQVCIFLLLKLSRISHHIQKVKNSSENHVIQPNIN
jgi:hypothetical protein